MTSDGVPQNSNFSRLAMTQWVRNLMVVQNIKTLTWSCRAEDKVRQLTSAFGANSAHVVRINSRTAAEPVPTDPAFWSSHLRSRVAGGGAGEPAPDAAPAPAALGAGLSVRDLEGLAAFMQAFVVRSLLPHLEMRVRTLNHQVGDGAVSFFQ